jgi:PIN domain nuclease of toxin-antitoxin system
MAIANYQSPANTLSISIICRLHIKDPFDRIVVAQATVEGITLLTNDRRLAGYSGTICKV